jgi:ATP-dependent DNA ligase
MTLPQVQPIIPIWRKEPFDDPDWLFDFKYDGFRAVCYLERGRCRFISRNGNVLSRFEGLVDQPATVLQIEEAIIDGRGDRGRWTGRPQFYDLLRRAPAPAYAPAAAASRVARGLGDRFRCAFCYWSRLRALRPDVRE